jgi:cytidine deaminase
MFDLYPDLKVIIRVGEGLRTVTVDELLPFAYVSGFRAKANPDLESGN